MEVDGKKQQKLTSFGIGTQISFSKENDAFVPQVREEEKESQPLGFKEPIGLEDMLDPS